jgi:hypothetical protein
MGSPKFKEARRHAFGACTEAAFGWREIDYRVIFDAVPGLYMLIDPALNIVTVNDAYARATMIDKVAVAGRALFEAMRGSIFAAHDTGGAVALVETGAPGIHVFRENRDLGKSDAKGELLLTGLDAYGANHVSVEPRDYAFDVVVEKTDAMVRPAAAAAWWWIWHPWCAIRWWR